MATLAQYRGFVSTLLRPAVPYSARKPILQQLAQQGGMDLLETLGIAPPAAENAVCYELYDQSYVHGASQAQLEALRVSCMQLALPYLEGYIWQHDTFTLQSSLQQSPPWVLKKRGKAKQQQQQQQPELPCLWGVVRYDDNVEDEWFVVWVLLELSRQLPGLCVRVWDDDGDFMLIEAAYSLPRWLKPETSTNRVWLRRGQLHIIPPPSARTPTLPAQPTLREAVNILSSGNINTHRLKVEGPVLSRLSGYPEKAQQQQQRVLAWLPRRVGRLLQEDPQLVAAAAAAFMTRTREEVQSAAKHSQLPPHDMTTALVTLNRCQYAQLMQADFNPPRRYPAPDGHDWLGGDAARQDKARGMGAKIHTGMEIMCMRMGLNDSSSSSKQDTPAGSAEPTASSSQQQQQQQQLPSNPAWHHYLMVLRQSGYFTGELEGSARYKQLLAAAQTAFQGTAAHLSSSEALAAPIKHLQKLLNRIGQQQEGQLQQQQHAERGATAGAAVAAARRAVHSAAAVLDADELSEDSDDWMESEAAAVQQQLAAAEAEAAAHEARKQQRKAAGATAGLDRPAEHPSSQQQQQHGPGDTSSSTEAVMIDAEQLVAGFKGFVQHAAGPEGAEVPTQATAAAAAGRSAASVEFNPDVFLTELMGVFGATDPGNSSSSASRQQQQDPDAALSQLQSLQQQLMRVLEDRSFAAEAGLKEPQAHVPGSGAPQAYVENDSSDDGCDSTSTEGSSFYDSNGSEDETSEHEEPEHKQAVGWQLNSAGMPPVQLEVPPPVSGVHKQQQQAGESKQQKQQQQQQWQLPPSFRGSALQKAWEVMTATDSDDEDNLSLGGSDDSDDNDTEGDTRDRHDANESATAGFYYDAYSTALEAELAGTTLAQSFERAPVQAATADSGTDTAAAPAGPAGLAPLDVDLNLIRSLVASYTAQGGLPGPASNLAGLLGLQLPTDVLEEH